MSNPAVQAILARITTQQYSFITKQDLKELRQLIPNPALPVLVRCGCERFVCTLNTLEFRMKQTEVKGDYVRDVSIPHPMPAEWKSLG